jgi:hypothetical protein
MKRRPDSAGNAERYDEDEGYCPELQRVAKRGQDERRDRRAKRIGSAHIASHEMANPIAVLDQQRAIQTQFAVEVGNGAWVRQRAQYGTRDITWKKLPADKDDDAEQPQRNQ